MSADIIPLSDTRALAALDKKLARSDKGSVLPSVSNLILILSEDPTLAGMCQFDEFLNTTVITRAAPSPIEGAPDVPGPYPRPYTHTDVSHTQSYIQRVYTQQAKKSDVDDAMAAVAASSRFHPIRDWLNTLTWDGMWRLDTWAHHAFGVPQAGYEGTLCAKLLIAAVRRVRHPGCKFDNLTIFEGEQGIGKSRTLRALFSPQPEWFSDSLLASLEHKDAAQALQGVWCLEMAEIAQMIRADPETTKEFLSRQIDRYRAPYARSTIATPRQCVLVGTTNQSDYLRDPTGNRRFWPITCHHAKPDWAAANRDQIWAEAAAREAFGEPHWVEDDPETENTIQIAQSARIMDDSWQDRILEWTAPFRSVVISEILSDALGIPIERHDKRAQMRVASILRHAGFARVLTWRDGKPVRRWNRP
jgi:putative DNA primase/helicase